MYLQPKKKILVRFEYNVSDMMVEAGGFLKAVMFAFALLLAPISRFSYYLEQMCNLYLAKSEDHKLFVKKKKGDDK